MISYVGPCDSVPYLSQYDTRIDTEDQPTFCGVASLYMVLNYWCQKKGKVAPSFEDVSQYALSLNGLDPEEGWAHAKLADTARHFGFNAISRTWFARQNDIDIMCNQGRLSNEQEAGRYQQQVFAEFMCTVFAMLVDEFPVILSVKPKLGPAKSNHLVVVTGVDHSRENLLIHDPQYKAHEGENIIVTTDRFLQFSNFNAILVYDEALQS